MGPSALRYAGLQSRLEQLNYQVFDQGNVQVPNPEIAIAEGKIRRLRAVATVCQVVYKMACQCVQKRILGFTWVAITVSALERLCHLPRLHFSLDMDSLVPEKTPGVGTPVPGGLTYREAHLLMEILGDSGRVHSLDVVEINPILDNGDRTAELAVALIAPLLGQRIL